ncbi:MAG: protein kinase, partial [Myxococcota bacterium]
MVRRLFDELVDLDADEAEQRLERLTEPTEVVQAVRRLLRTHARGSARTYDLSPLRREALGEGAAQRPLHVGQRFGDHELLHRLGIGGTAEVWAVRHRGIGLISALKVLHRPSPALRERLKREGAAQARLAHPHLVSVQKVLEVEQRLGLLMQFVRGPSLGALQAALGTLPPTGALALFHGVVLGVAHAHRHGVVHRDLKPDNVLLDLADGRLVPKISDFGLVKELDAAGPTVTGMVMGTPAYAAPEQLADSRHVDERADIFSLGVMLVELLVGERPFGGTSLDEIKRGHGSDPKVAEVAEPWRAFAEQMLQRDPRDRMGDLNELLRTLADHVPSRTRAPELVAVAEELVARPLSDDPLVGRPSPVTGEPEHSLPSRRDAFVGRKEEVAELTARVCGAEPPRLLTVIGPGGVGKTRLCLETAHASRDRFPGGTWWMDLAQATDESGIVAAVASALRIELGPDPVAQLGHAMAYLGRSLVVLDNLEQVVDALPSTLGGWIDRAPETVFLATSRQPLRLRGEQHFSLAPMADDDAVSLFVERARSVQPSFVLDRQTRPDVLRLTELLDGLPLAVEL